MSAAQRYGELADGVRIPAAECGSLHPEARHLECDRLVDRAGDHPGRHLVRNKSGIYGWAAATPTDLSQ